MKNKPKRESKRLFCPKVCVLNQLDDDRLSDTIVLETQKAIASTIPMLTNEEKNQTMSGTSKKVLHAHGETM